MNKGVSGRRAAKRLDADLTALGDDGSYVRVVAFACDGKRNRQYEQQTSGCGIFQFDWSGDCAVHGDEMASLMPVGWPFGGSVLFEVVRARDERRSTPITCTPHD